MENVGWVPPSISLLPDSGCTETSCLVLLPQSSPHNDGLYPQTVSHNTPFSSCISFLWYSIIATRKVTNAKGKRKAFNQSLTKSLPFSLILISWLPLSLRRFLKKCEFLKKRKDVSLATLSFNCDINSNQRYCTLGRWGWGWSTKLINSDAIKPENLLVNFRYV